MDQNRYPTLTVLHHGLLRYEAEAHFLHILPKQGLPPAAGIRDENLPTGREQRGDEPRQRLGVPLLVEHVGGENEVEAAFGISHRGRVPVQEARLRLVTEVEAGVVAGEVEGGLVVVGSHDLRAAGEGDDGRQADPATELDGANPCEVFSCEVAGQRRGARPEVGPVGEALVALEVGLVQQGFGGPRMYEVVRPVSYFDSGFGQARAAFEVTEQARAERVRFSGVGRLYREREAAGSASRSRAARVWRSSVAIWAIV